LPSRRNRPRRGPVRVSMPSARPACCASACSPMPPGWWRTPVVPAITGPAWLLAKEYARLLKVKLDPVLVSHETKIPVLAANQVDLSITALAETPERVKVVDFVIYSNTSFCLFGLASNPKFAAAKTVDDLNKPDITIAYFVGAAEEGWVKQRFPLAKLRGVTNSGATAPLEDVMAHRADAAPINRIPYVAMARKVKGLGA